MPQLPSIPLGWRVEFTERKSHETTEYGYVVQRWVRQRVGWWIFSRVRSRWVPAHTGLIPTYPEAVASVPGLLSFHTHFPNITPELLGVGVR